MAAVERRKPVGDGETAWQGMKSRIHARLLDEVDPMHIAFAFDESLTTSFRNEIYPEYKANRESAPEAFPMRRVALTTALGSILVSAGLGVFALLGGGFGPTQGKILSSSIQTVRMTIPTLGRTMTTISRLVRCVSTPETIPPFRLTRMTLTMTVTRRNRIHLILQVVCEHSMAR